METHSILDKIMSILAMATLSFFLFDLAITFIVFIFFKDKFIRFKKSLSSDSTEKKNPRPLVEDHIIEHWTGKKILKEKLTSFRVIDNTIEDGLIIEAQNALYLMPPIVNETIYPEGKCIFDAGQKESSWSWSPSNHGVYIYTSEKIFFIEVEEIEEFIFENDDDTD